MVVPRSRNESVVVSPTCPTEDALGALVNHALDPDELATVTAHIDDCVACRKLVVAVVQAGLGSPQPPAAPGTVTEPSPARAVPRIGRYELRALLGVGGMGSVYEAHDTELDRRVALKVLRPELGRAPGLADRLIHESRLMAKVAHPAVITVYDVGCDGDTVFITMELIRGSTLTAWLAGNQLDWRAVVSLFERAGHGLAAAHGAGLVHRDFKPDNVLVSRDAGKVVVTDFGIAREVAPQTAVTATARAAALDAAVTLPGAGRVTADGAVIGTPAYMAPEQIAGPVVDVRTDVFAFSLALWEALFGARAFPGTTLVEIFAAMHSSRPRPPAGARRIPRRLLRALRKGLAFEPRDRWPDMPTLLAELGKIRSTRKRLLIAASVAGLIGFGGAVALAIAPTDAPVDRCLGALESLARAYNPQREAQLATVLTAEPKLQSQVVATLRETAERWRRTHLATCHAERDIAQDSMITACLDARVLELAGAVDEVIGQGPAGARYAARIAAIPGDPSACATPAPGLLFSRVPADGALRRQVTALRARLADAEASRDRGALAPALEEATQVVAAAEALWPPVYAEASYTLGLIQGELGQVKPALATLRAAAGIAEQAHHDEVAANSWIQLARLVASKEQDPTRALEYVSYAEAAADRIARPASLTMVVEYIKGMVLVAAKRTREGELALRKAIALAEPTGSDYFAKATLGLGYVCETDGRYADAAAAYRKAIERLPRSPDGQVVGPPVYFERLGLNLALVGQAHEADVWARRAVEIADRTLPETQSSRPVTHVHLAETLVAAGRNEEALAEMTPALAAIARIHGVRSQRYGEMLGLHSEILVHLGRYADAERQLTRACDIIAFANGDDASSFAMCEGQHGAALVGLHRYREAVTVMDRAVTSLIKVHGESHPLVAEVLLTRGTAHAALGHRAVGIRDFERTAAILANQQLNPGTRAAATWRLGKELWASDPPRARSEIATALILFKTASGEWSKERDEATAWLADRERTAR
jgi:tetratricopeptide (TPR) repeat protein/aminoglycoside phosphotransferase (APT) family kinase protein